MLIRHISLPVYPDKGNVFQNPLPVSITEPVQIRFIPACILSNNILSFINSRIRSFLSGSMLSWLINCNSPFFVLYSSHYMLETVRFSQGGKRKPPTFMDVGSWAKVRKTKPGSLRRLFTCTMFSAFTIYQTDKE